MLRLALLTSFIILGLGLIKPAQEAGKKLEKVQDARYERLEQMYK